MVEVIEHWIDGRSDPGLGQRTGEVTDPALGQVMAHVAMAEPSDVDSAVRSAQQASVQLRGLSLSKRQHLMFELRQLVEEHVDELAASITSQHGKTLADARGEVERGLEVVEFACALPHLLKGQYSDSVATDVDTFSLRQPLGVVAGITPFNFPVMVPMWMFPMALACGNAFILKPSERDPGPSLILARLVSEAGFPPGTLNVVHGDKVAVEALIEHPGVAAVSFVGSTPVARSIFEAAGRHGKRVQALGGAKNHLVVMPDADLDQVADALTSSAFGSAGERCMAVSVAVAVGGVGDALRDRLAERAGKLTIGPGTGDGVDMGPLITAAHRDRVASYIDAGVREGANLVVDGRGLVVDGNEQGFFLGPTIFDHVERNMSIYTDEIFGPVLSQVRVDTLSDAIDLVNSCPYGNGVALFTRDGAAARTFQRMIDVGMVGINVPIPVPVAMYSFGGWKDSLLGDLHVYGEDAVRFYTRQKVITARWSEVASGIDLGFPGSSR